MGLMTISSRKKKGLLSNLWPDREYTRLKTEDNKPAIYKLEQQILPPRHPYIQEEQPDIAQSQVSFEEAKASHVIQSIPGDLI